MKQIDVKLRDTCDDLLLMFGFMEVTHLFALMVKHGKPITEEEKDRHLHISAEDFAFIDYFYGLLCCNVSLLLLVYYEFHISLCFFLPQDYKEFWPPKGSSIDVDSGNFRLSLKDELVTDGDLEMLTLEFILDSIQVLL